MKSYLLNKNILRFFLYLLVSFSLVSCEKEIEVDLNSSEPRIVIEALVELDSLATVRITRSQDYDQTGGFPPVDGALVKISDNFGNEEILKQNVDGLYVAETIKGVVGYTYQLSVNVDGANYTSTSTMPQPVEIDSLYIFEIPALETAYPMINFQDIPGQDNYYRALLFVNGKRAKIVVDVTDDQDRDGTLISFLLTYDRDANEEEEIQQGDSISVYLQCIDKGAHTFFESLGRIGTTLNNPTSNISGGALGYFSAYTSSEKSIVASW